MTPENSALANRLNHLLTLADRLPSGASENHVRRCVCEVIEADAPHQQIVVVALLNSILQLQQERRLGSRRAHQAGAPPIDRLLAALCEGVLPLLLLPGSPNRAGRSDGNDQNSNSSPAPPDVVSEAPIPFDQESWNRWTARGREADAVFSRKVRKISVLAAILMALGVLWRFS